MTVTQFQASQSIQMVNSNEVKSKKSKICEFCDVPGLLTREFAAMRRRHPICSYGTMTDTDPFIAADAKKCQDPHTGNASMAYSGTNA